MAQIKSGVTAHPETLILPLRFRASIQRVADTLRVGDWIVGFQPEDVGEGNSEEYVPGDLPQEWEFDRLPVEWLTSYLGLVREYSEKLQSHSPAPDTVTRALVASGTFREEDWVETERISKGTFPIGDRIGTLPKEVRDQICRLNVRGQKRVYVLRIDDFWLEWRLLESLALLAGNLSRKLSIVASRGEAEEAWRLLEQLKGNASGTKPRNVPKVPPGSLGDHTRTLIRDVVQGAFWRVLNKPTTTFRYGVKDGPSLTLAAKSVLAIAYVVLLHNFAQGWKRCKRPDCQKLFPITDDTRKVFCSQYCGHVESQRKNRRERRGK